MYLSTIKEYLSEPVPDYLISQYAQKRKDLELPPLPLPVMEKRLKPSVKTLKKYREEICILFEDYRQEKRNNQIGKVERATDFIRYCWETVHLSKVLLRDLKIPEILVYDELKARLINSNLLTLTAFKTHENHNRIKSIQYYAG